MRKTVQGLSIAAVVAGLLLSGLVVSGSAVAEPGLVWGSCPPAPGVVLDPRQECATVEVPLDYRHPGGQQISRLSPREHEVLALMAEGRSNVAIMRALAISDKAVAKHINAIFTKLDLPPDNTDDHRRVRAVLTYPQS
jgi:DNA-binding CsgD family transcriptional regulator